MADILYFNNTYLRNGLSEALPSNWIMSTLVPTTNADNKTKFFNRVRSKIIAQVLQGVFDQTLWNKIMTMKDRFSWTDANSDTY